MLVRKAALLKSGANMNLAFSQYVSELSAIEVLQLIIIFGFEADN